jgi:uncharacterized protein (DUF2062 family)
MVGTIAPAFMAPNETAAVVMVERLRAKNIPHAVSVVVAIAAVPAAFVPGV